MIYLLLFAMVHICLSYKSKNIHHQCTADLKQPLDCDTPMTGKMGDRSQRITMWSLACMAENLRWSVGLEFELVR